MAHFFTIFVFHFFVTLTRDIFTIKPRNFLILRTEGANTHNLSERDQVRATRVKEQHLKTIYLLSYINLRFAFITAILELIQNTTKQSYIILQQSF
jgi:hypothetical protein